MPNDNTKTSNTNQTNDIPQVFSEDVLPPMPQNSIVNSTTPNISTAPNNEVIKENATVEQKTDSSNSGSAAPSDDINLPPVVMGTTPKKKFGSGKVIATILGLFLLVGGLGAGTMLVQQNQDIRERAGACGGGCGPGGQCAGDLNGDGTGECVPRGTTDDQIESAMNGGGGLNSIGGYESTINTDGTYNDGGGGGNQTWNEWQEAQGGASVESQNCNAPAGLEFLCGSKCSDQPNVVCMDSAPNNLPTGYTSECNTATNRCTICSGTCNADGSNVLGEYRIQASTGGGGGGGGGGTPTDPPGGSNTASCQNVKAYGDDWTLLTTTQLGQLSTSDTVNFCVAGVATGGSFDKAKFTINGVAQAETTTLRPSSTDFCQSYVIPAGVTSFNVTAQIHHATLGWK